MPQSKHTQRMERRTSARTDANLSMRLMGARAETALPEFVTETENVSSSGVYCFSPHYLAPLSKVGLTLVLPDRRYRGAWRRILHDDGHPPRLAEFTRVGVATTVPALVLCPLALWAALQL